MRRLITASMSEAVQALDKYTDNPNSVNNENLKQAIENVVQEEAKDNQSISSKDTSLNQVPKLFNDILSIGGFFGNNYDNGGGKFDKATEWYKNNTQWLNRVYDKYNRDEEHNAKTDSYDDYSHSTIANVLNVIKEDECIPAVLEKSKSKAPITYISVHQGNKSGEGRLTKDSKDKSKLCWQRNQETWEYLPMVEKVFGKGNYSIKSDMIVAWDPTRLSEEKIQELKSSPYNTSPQNFIKYQQRARLLPMSEQEEEEERVRKQKLIDNSKPIPLDKVDLDDPALSLSTYSGKSGGGEITRYQHNVGKYIGNKIYVHKNYASEVIPSDTLLRGEEIVAEKYPEFNYNCITYDTKAHTLWFNEAPDFDSAREPHVGDIIVVNEDGTTKKSHSNSIWHHKWLWVKDDYDGFDVKKSKLWSAQWLLKMPEAAKGTDKSWNKQLQDNGLA